MKTCTLYSSWDAHAYYRDAHAYQGRARLSGTRTLEYEKKIATSLGKKQKRLTGRNYFFNLKLC